MNVETKNRSPNHMHLLPYFSWIALNRTVTCGDVKETIFGPPLEIAAIVVDRLSTEHDFGFPLQSKARLPVYRISYDQALAVPPGLLMDCQIQVGTFRPIPIKNAT